MKNTGLFRIQCRVQILHPQDGRMAKEPKTGGIKGVAGGRDLRATKGRKKHRRVDSPKKNEVLEQLPRSAGIDWVAETGGVEELPSEELRIPDARRDDFREMIGEEVVSSATSGDDAGEEMHEEVVPEEVGGPFVETSAEKELGSGSDESNPPDAEPEPLPRVISSTPDLPPR
jgi:hypothetical protein